MSDYARNRIVAAVAVKLESIPGLRVYLDADAPVTDPLPVVNVIAGGQGAPEVFGSDTDRYVMDVTIEMFGQTQAALNDLHARLLRLIAADDRLGLPGIIDWRPGALDDMDVDHSEGHQPLRVQAFHTLIDYLTPTNSPYLSE